MKNVLYIGNKLRSSRHNISYIDILGPLLEAEGINVYYASGYNNKVRRLFHMISSIVLLRSKVNLVLIDTYSTQNFYYAYITSKLCRIFNIPYVPILHGGNLKYRLEASPKMSQSIFQNAKINIAPSQFMKDQFNQFGYSNIEYIPNVLELDNYVISEKRYDFPRLLWVRSFSEIYNPALAIHTFEKLKNDHPNAELCMVGPDSDGSLSQIKEMSERLNLNVKFTGKLTKPEWIQLSETYNVFINTSNFDNMPLSVVEAMALGLPIISTNVGGMSYLIEDRIDGLLVHKNDAHGMAYAIIETFNNVEETKLRVSAARRKVEHFDWRNMREKWLDVLSNNIASS